MEQFGAGEKPPVSSEGEQKEKPSQEASSASAPEQPEVPSADVAAFVPRNVEQGLADLGYSAEERSKLKPEEAQEILAAQRKSSGGQETEEAKKPETYTYRFDEGGKAVREDKSDELKREVATLEREARELGDPKLEKEARELKETLERTPEKEREKMGVGIHNFGFFVEETKNNILARIFKGIAGAHKELETSDVVTRKEPRTPGKKSVTGKFLAQLGTQFEKDAAKAHERMVAIEKTKKRETFANAGYIAGNAVKVWTLASGAVTMPLRAVALGAMAFARGADAAKEVRFENEKVIEKTRLDEEKAWEEAEKIYAEKTREKGTMSGKEIEKVYRESLPKDILARLEAKTPEQPSLMNRMVQGFVKLHIERSVNRLERKIAKIEENEKLTVKEKSAKRERLMNRFERRLRDYDRAVGQLGTVDALAMGLRYAEMTGKVATYIPATYVALDKGFEAISGLFGRSEVMDTLEDARDAAASGPAAVVDSGAVPKMKGEVIQNLERYAGMPRTVETAPADALRQSFTVSRPGASFGMPNAPVESTSVEIGSSAPPPSEAASIDSTEVAKVPEILTEKNQLADLYRVHPEFANTGEWKVSEGGAILRQGYPGTYELDKEGNLWYTGGPTKEGVYAPQVLKAGGDVWEEAKETAMAEKAAAQEIGDKEMAVEPKTVKPSSGVMETKIVERAAPITDEELRVLKEMRGASEISAEQMGLATVQKGEGVTHALVRQLKVNPEQFGYDPKGGVDVDKWAVLKSKEIAIGNGYIKPDGTEIRVLDQGPKGNPAYILEKDASGKLNVKEYLGGKATGGDDVKSSYEYEWKKPAYSAEVVARAKAAAEGIPEMIPSVREIAEMPMKLERVPVTELAPAKFPEWLNERLEYSKLAETLPEKTANLEHVSDQFDTYSLRVQEDAIKELASFEKQLDYLEKHADTLGLTPSQEDFVEMSKESIEDMKEAFVEAQEEFKEQLADVGVAPAAYEKAVAKPGLTVKQLFEMAEKKELDMKKWGKFASWVHALKPTAIEQEMKVDAFLKSVTPDKFVLAQF